MFRLGIAGFGSRKARRNPPTGVRKVRIRTRASPPGYHSYVVACTVLELGVRVSVNSSLSFCFCRTKLHCGPCFHKSLSRRKKGEKRSEGSAQTRRFEINSYKGSGSHRFSCLLATRPQVKHIQAGSLEYLLTLSIPSVATSLQRCFSCPA